MKAVARRVEGFAHRVEVDGHELLVDEPTEAGGTDTGPSATRLLTASLASCTAITVVMYANRKGWDVGELEVSAEFGGAERGETARFDVTLRLPAALTDEQVERTATVAAKCPVHRILVGEVEVIDHVERV